VPESYGLTGVPWLNKLLRDTEDKNMKAYTCSVLLALNILSRPWLILAGVAAVGLALQVLPVIGVEQRRQASFELS